MWVSASVCISELLGTASFGFPEKLVSQLVLWFWGFGSDSTKHSKKPFLISLERQSMLKYPKYRDIETRYKLSPSHFDALS